MRLPRQLSEKPAVNTGWPEESPESSPNPLNSSRFMTYAYVVGCRRFARADSYVESSGRVPAWMPDKKGERFATSPGESTPMWSIYHDITRFLRRMGPEEFFLVIVVGAIIGFFCLRGFGSRAKY
jgi:hypothetical protein